MCFADGHRNGRTSTIRTVFCLFGSIAGFRPSWTQLRSSGQKPSFAGTALDFGRIGAGDRATLLADRGSRLSCALSDVMPEVFGGIPKVTTGLLAREANAVWKK